MFKKLFQQTFVYGVATVLPRALAIVLVPLYTSVLEPSSFGVYATLMAYIILGNVLLSYGMETTFFRFINKKEAQKPLVQSTALTSVTISSILVFLFVYLLKDWIAQAIDFEVRYIEWAVQILVLDALVVIPFVWYRANQKPLKYAAIKIVSVCINLGVNIFFFLALPVLDSGTLDNVWGTMRLVEDPVDFIFKANVIASGATLVMVLPLYAKIKFKFNLALWKQMMRYGFPVLIAGIAFSINEAFDKILLNYLLPEDIAENEVGIYAACYKLGVFITLFATAFRLGIEPFFFNHAAHKNAPATYAIITKYFVLLGSAMLLFVLVYVDVFKQLLIKNEAYWEALSIVPLILLANLCLGIYHNLSVWYKVTDRTQYGAYISVIGAVITIGVNIALIPFLGYMGAAIATLCAYGSMMLLSYFFGRKKYPIPYDLKKIGAYLGLSLGFSIFSFYVFDRNLYIGTVLFLVFLFVVYFLEKKEITRMLKQ